MSITEKSILLLSNDPAQTAATMEALKPMVRSLLVAKNTADAVQKASNQDFDAIILRMNTPILSDPKEFFHWCLRSKAHKTTPWVVLGKDVEDEQIVVTHNFIKFVQDPAQPMQLVKILEGIFFNPASGSIDVGFINPLMAAVVETIKTMAQMELKREAPFVRRSTSQAAPAGDISGIIAMNSNFFLGSLAISFQEKVIFKVFENMLGTKVNSMTDDVKDCVSEITNIIFGNAKRDLNAAGHTIAAALPSVIIGKDHRISHALNGTCICVPFTCLEGRILVECMISPKAG